jgi:hypothetical protein
MVLEAIPKLDLCTIASSKLHRFFNPTQQSFSTAALRVNPDAAAYSSIAADAKGLRVRLTF